MGKVFKNVASAAKSVVSNPARSLVNAASLGAIDYQDGKLSAGNNANIAANIASMGMIGVGENGQLGMGIQPQLAVQGLGEITGANAMREQVKLQQDAVTQAEENARKQRMEMLYQQMNNDIQSSLMAGAMLGGRRNTNYLGMM